MHEPKLDITEDGSSCTITVRVIPRSSRSEIVGELDGAVKVRLSAPPVDGAANAELIKLLAKTLGVSKSKIEIVSGQTSKTKRIRIHGLTAKQVQQLMR